MTLVGNMSIATQYIVTTVVFVLQLDGYKCDLDHCGTSGQVALDISVPKDTTANMVSATFGR